MGGFRVDTLALNDMQVLRVNLENEAMISAGKSSGPLLLPYPWSRDLRTERNQNLWNGRICRTSPSHFPQCQTWRNIRTDALQDGISGNHFVRISESYPSLFQD